MNPYLKSLSIFMSGSMLTFLSMVIGHKFNNPLFASIGFFFGTIIMLLSGDPSRDSSSKETK